jgi:predicted tellurium resistance membrane protein TerC
VKIATSYWLLATGYWLLAIGYWLLAIGYWLLATGYRLYVEPLSHNPGLRTPFRLRFSGKVCAVTSAQTAAPST